MPAFPEISFTLEWRNRTGFQTLEAILDEINSCMLSMGHQADLGQGAIQICSGKSALEP